MLRYRVLVQLTCVEITVRGEKGGIFHNRVQKRGAEEFLRLSIHNVVHPQCGRCWLKGIGGFRWQRTKHIPGLSVEITETQDHLHCESPNV